MTAQQLTFDGTPAPMVTRQQITRHLLSTFPVSRDLAEVLAALILGRRVFAATLSGGSEPLVTGHV